MYKKKILNIEPENYSIKAISIWEKLKFEYSESTWKKIERKNIKNDSTIIIVRLGKYISKKELSYFPNLKFIISATTGITHLDMNLISDLNIKPVLLTNHKEFLDSIPSTAEFTWGLILSLIKKIPSSINHVKNYKWNRNLFIGNQLKEKRIGIIGLGRTGLKVAKYANAFEMDIYYYDPYVNNKLYSKISDFQLFLKTCDIFSFHVHSNKSTHHMINNFNISNIKKNSFLINTSRGEIIDQNAVCKAIRSGQISGFATDVLENEYLNKKNNELIDLMKKGENIIITPHIAGASFEAMRQTEIYLADYFVKKYNKEFK